MVLTTEFTIDKVSLKQNFDSEINIPWREYYFRTYTEQQRRYLHCQYNSYLLKHKKNIGFFIFLKEYLELSEREWLALCYPLKLEESPQSRHLLLLLNMMMNPRLISLMFLIRLMLLNPCINLGRLWIMIIQRKNVS